MDLKIKLNNLFNKIINQLKKKEKSKEDVNKISLEKELKKYPKEDRERLRKRFEEFETGKILKIEPINKGKKN